MASFERALAVSRARFGPDHPVVATALKTLARGHAAQGDHAASLPLFEEALRIYEARFGADSIQASNVRQDLAVIFHALGDLDGSRRLFQHALVTVEARKGAGSLDAIALRHNGAAGGGERIRPIPAPDRAGGGGGGPRELPALRGWRLSRYGR